MDKINKSSYSNYIRVKTVYELAMEANPSMFFPHDEFETVKEYKSPKVITSPFFSISSFHSHTRRKARRDKRG